MTLRSRIDSIIRIRRTRRSAALGTAMTEGASMRRRSKRRQKGFTLLEVLMATALLAVGSVSVMVVMATAIGFASQRQAGQRLTQVLEEARYDAQAAINEFNPTKGSPAPGDQDGAVAVKQSAIYTGYTYGLTFVPVDKEVLEAGYQVDITVEFGDGLTRNETVFLGADVIPDSEFTSSITFEAERRGEDGVEGRDER